MLDSNAARYQNLADTALALREDPTGDDEADAQDLANIEAALDRLREGARATLRAHLDDTDGEALDPDDYAAEAADGLFDDDTDEVSDAVRLLAGVSPWTALDPHGVLHLPTCPGLDGVADCDPRCDGTA